jgi:Arc/MetJ-type ribon-helix-helix transcriptional regulator
MKRKISVQLTDELADRLEAAVQDGGASKSAIVEAALQRFLGIETETVDNSTLSRRLDWMSGQLEQLERELRIVNETVALHARYHLTIAPPLPAARQHGACVLGIERFEVFAAQVGRRVHLGTPLMRETMERLSETKPELFASDTDQEVPLGTASEGADDGPSASNAVTGDLESSAGVGEGASKNNFPWEEAHNPYR